MNRMIALVGLVLGAVGLYACGTDASGPCSTADDCAATEVCLNGSCSAVPGATPTPDGATEDAAAQGGDQATGPDGVGALEPFTLGFQEIALSQGHKRVTGFAFIPGTDDEFLVLEQPGTVSHYALDSANDTASLLGSFELEDTYLEQDCGLIAVAFDPEFEANGFMYMAHCEDVKSSTIYRLVFDPSDYGAIPDSRADIINVGDPEPDLGPSEVLASEQLDAPGRSAALRE